MKAFLLVLFLFVFSLQASAQTVSKVTNNEALVDVGSATLNVGDSVDFLDNNLSSVAKGKVSKVSSGGKKALVQITSGHATAGMTLEKSTAPTSAEKSSSESPQKFNLSNLSEDDRRILERGEISTTRYVVGGVLGTYPLGFGIGHAIQERYSDRGWIFTVGELGSIVVAAAGMGDCVTNWSSSGSCNGGLFFLGIFSFVGFRIWEIIDLWAVPPELNERYRELKHRMGDNITFRPVFVPQANGGFLGLQMTF